MTRFKPFYEQVQAHYDLSDDFFALFLDPSMTYSCAYFEREDMTLAEAQQAKIDLSLGKCDLKPGQTLLDIGCGWGATLRRAATQHKVNGIGLTLSRHQHAHVQQSLAELPSDAGRVEVRLQGWEEFDEPADRIVSIGAFEHFRMARYPAFFEKCHALLPADGRMMLHTIVMPDRHTLAEKGIAVDHEHVLFAKFIGKHIFPGGQLCSPAVIEHHAQQAGFNVARTQSLQLHYARTLDLWAEKLEAERDQAIALTDQQTYDIYMKYLTGCAAHFRSGHIDIVQFTLTA
ncbi:MAG: cyclopropane mycolic acid synthase family methyltransferase [Phycisphaeraceae bacterium]